MDRFILREKIGDGGFGKVYRVEEKSTGKKYALKICQLCDAKQEAFYNILAEMLVVKKLSDECEKNPNIGEYLMIPEEIFLENTKTCPRVCILMKLATFDLYTAIHHGNIAHGAVKAIMTALCRSVKLLNSLGILHCDLKPSNVLLFENEQKVRLCDFNSVKIGEFHDTPGCTLWYRAPESLKNHTYDEKTEVWSMGCIFYEIVAKKVLFKNNEQEMHEAVIDKMLRIMDMKEMDKVHPFISDLLQGMLKKDPQERFSLDQVMYHKYFTESHKSDLTDLNENVNM